MYKGMGVRFADFISFFLNIPLRPKYFIFIGYLKMGGGGCVGSSEPPLDLPLDSCNSGHLKTLQTCERAYPELC